MLDAYIGPGLQLMEQSLDLDGREMTLVVPRSSDAVIDMYLNAGDPYFGFISSPTRACMHVQGFAGCAFQTCHGMQMRIAMQTMMLQSSFLRPTLG